MSSSDLSSSSSSLSSSSSSSLSSCIVSGENTRYHLIELVGKGCFGTVVKSLDLNTNKMVAVKIPKQHSRIHKELEMLQAIKVLDPDQYNIVRFIEGLTVEGYSLLIFEMLDKSLRDLMNDRGAKPLPLNDIRNMTKQLLVALDGLKSIKIMHTDLKLDNIMFVNHHDQPFKVKVIDFGLAIRESEAKDGMIIQNCAYRAPEVSLGLPLTTAVDMWGLGCIISILFFGRRIFPGTCDYSNLSAIVSLMGCIEQDKLNKGKYSNLYFTSRWDGQLKLKSPEEYEAMFGKIRRPARNLCEDFRTLDEAVLSQPGCQDARERSDRMAFIDFLRCCLNVDADQRISPRGALMHSFITNTNDDSKTESGNNVADSAYLPVNQVGASEHEENVSQEQKEPNNNEELIQHLCNKINELQHNYDEVKRLLRVQEARTNALYEELQLLKEKQNKTKIQESAAALQDQVEENNPDEEVKDLEEQVVEPAPELSQVNRSQSLDVSEQPAPETQTQKTQKRLSWWKRVRNFFRRK